MQLSRFAKVTALSVAPLTLVAGGFQASALADQSAQDAQPAAAAFSASALSARSDGGLKDVSGFSSNSTQGKTMKAEDFGVMRAASGEAAVVDSSMARQGVTTAAGKGFVELSWKGYTKDARYVVTREGKSIATLGAGVTSFRDTDVKAGADYTYQVIPLLPKGGNPNSRLYGMRVAVPHSGSLTGLRELAVERASTAAVAKKSTLSWVGFIPQKYVAAPIAGCDYGQSFKFGGDNHKDFNWKSNKYRFALHATITWKTKKVVSNKHINPTTVYVKKTNKYVGSKTATAKNTYAKKLASSGNTVGIRMVVHATNPYCKGLGGVKGAASGAFTISMSKSGNYEIRSGTHRQYPNNYVYIYDGGKVTNVHKKKHGSTKCLVGSVMCPQVDMTGLYGKF
ncbi:MULTISPECIES: hypothetical protein [Streptomyces]|uniref:Uncharacterized protein n=1 Tax=Streptomyces bottropensis ATCC 25435 TaxID=1054862 RepID=M3E9F1_9ACTN|nr:MULTISPECIES: hypothetical protein [Streptomyces]EMF52761.1 hypothetical protein SBD_5837 [Streptomyces bottropensis ATCC 25435]MZD21841.1 hypothetical protein [Streptomyces sp. SID5476]